MMVRLLGCALLATLLAGAGGTHPPERAAAPSGRPNLIVILSDDQRWDALGSAGNAIIQTPNLDALAREGILFRNAYVTSPICMMSRASILTGQYARRHGILDFSTDLSAAAFDQSYPALLRRAGYRTGFVGKYGIGVNPPVQEFDHFRAYPGQGHYEARDAEGRPKHLTRVIADDAIAFLDSLPRGQPFALSIGFKAPHVQDDDPRQFIPEPVDATLYENITIPPPATAGDRYWLAQPAFFRINNEARVRWHPLFSTPGQYQASVRGYYRMVTGMDRAVGEIRTALRRLNLERNSVVIFSSDNGFYLGELGLSHKWYGHDPSIRVPLLISDPRRPPTARGRIESAIALNIDLAPTVLDLAGVPVPGGMQGRSLVPLLHGVRGPWRADFLIEHMFEHAGIRRWAGVAGGRYKYLRYVDETPPYELLYDLRADPRETVDRARDPAYRAQLSALRRRYQELLSAAH